MPSCRAVMLIAVLASWAGVGCCVAATGHSQAADKTAQLLGRLFSYKDSVTWEVPDTFIYTYTRYDIHVPRRNSLMMLVPSLYVVAKGRREYAGERYTRLDVDGDGLVNSYNVVNTGTVPRHKATMPSVAEYLVPHMYDVTLTQSGHTLSPFNAENARYYHYTVTPLTGNRAEVLFRPKITNTQLIHGTAIVDAHSGRLMSTAFYGEYDMVRMRFRIDMGNEGPATLYPKTVSVSSDFRCLGNNILADFFTVYDVGRMVADSVRDSHDRALMDSIRPVPLPAEDSVIYSRFDSLQATAGPHTDSRWKALLWDAIGDNVVNRITSRFGQADRGYLRLSPLLNPLYLDYSHNRGLSYKIKVRLRYDFTPQSDIALYLKGGYSFKLREFYYRNTLRYTIWRRHGFYAEMVGTNGNRQTSVEITEKIKNMALRDIRWGDMGEEYFRHSSLTLRVNYDLSSRWSAQAGLVYHHHSADNSRRLAEAGQDTEYKTMAPMAEIQYRPTGWHGMAFTVNYERGLRNRARNSTEYERIEADWSWVMPYSTVRSLSLRVGGGIYTDRSSNSYFVNYSNFTENNLSDGWNDDWSGDFQLLNSHWYNASEYYIRTNITYESPLMVMSRLPWVGRYMETERLYASALWVEKMRPYIEYGYGFTNRLFSLGFFVATRNASYDGIGVRLALELFSGW